MWDIEISVILLTYNYWLYLPVCLQSVHKALHDKWEIILVDDGSSDLATQEFLQKHATEYKIIYTNRKWPSYARNKWIKEARGLYILFLDADDYLHENYIVHAINHLQKTWADFFYPSYQCFGNIHDIHIMPQFSIPNLLMKNYIIITCIIKKEFLMKSQVRFDEAMGDGLEDRDFRISCAEKWISWVSSTLPLVFIRKHTNTRTRFANLKKTELFAYIYEKHKKFYKTQLSFFQLLILRLEFSNTEITHRIVNLLPVRIRHWLKWIHI